MFLWIEQLQEEQVDDSKRIDMNLLILLWVYEKLKLHGNGGESKQHLIFEFTVLRYLSISRDKIRPPLK